MIVREMYKITWAANVACPAAKTLQEISARAANEEELSVKVVLGKEQKMGRWPVYLDSEESKNLLGYLTGITDKAGTQLDDEDIRAITKEEYRVILRGPQTKNVSGDLELSLDEAGPKKVSSEGGGFEETTKQLIESGVITQSDVDKNISYMLENGVSRSLIERVLSRYRLYDKPAHTPSCWYVDPDLAEKQKSGQEGIIAEALRMAVDGFGIILEGEKSTGKNVFLETLARLLWMPLGLTTMTSEMTPAAMYSEKTTDNSASEELAGFDESILAKAKDLRQEIGILRARMQGKSREEINKLVSQMFTEEEKDILKEAERFEKLKAQAASVNIVMEESDFLNRLQNGGMFVLNEMNMARANFLASFTNQILDGTGFLFVPGRGRIDIHPDFVLVATQNPDYAGTEMQNDATMSRFGCLYFNQPESIKGQLMAAVRAAIDKLGRTDPIPPPKYFNEADAFYKHCRGAVAKNMVSSQVLNIRGFVRALTAVATSGGSTTLKRQVEIHVTNTCPFVERVAINQMANTIISL